MEWRLATSFPRPTCYRDEDEGLSPADDNDDQKGEDEEDIGGLHEALSLGAFDHDNDDDGEANDEWFEQTGANRLSPNQSGRWF